MGKQQTFSFYEPKEPNIEIIEIQATEEQKKEMVDVFSDIVWRRINERLFKKYPIVKDV